VIEDSRRPPEVRAANLYLELLKQTLTRSLFDQLLIPVSAKRRPTMRSTVFGPIRMLLARRGFVLARTLRARDVFAKSPPMPIPNADTLIGPVGIDNLRYCIEDVLARNVPGDFIETGAWRGGATIFMRGALEAHGDRTRTVWVADSFCGSPSPDVTRYPEDAGDEAIADMDVFAIPLDVVKQNFARYRLLDERVQFLPGWFHDTLPTAPIERLAVMRLDGDMYGSTMDALRFLYPLLSVGGYVIIDDYWRSKCRAAVDAYRADHGITEELTRVDRAIVYWQRHR
jgi:O-methyltransferase